MLLLLPGMRGEGHAMCRVKPHGEQVVAPGGRSMSVLIKNSLEIKKKKELTVNKAVN